MTYHDDAELAAITITRLATTESEDEPESRAIRRITTEMLKQHGPDAIVALVTALARHNASALYVVASYREVDVDVIIDDVESRELLRRGRD